jgi:hypothetical protein
MPSSNGGDDLGGIGGPNKGLGIIVGLGEEAPDGGLEIDQGSEHAALQPSLTRLGEKTLHGIEPGGRFRR